MRRSVPLAALALLMLVPPALAQGPGSRGGDRAAPAEASSVPAGAPDREDGVETENLFGFTAGSDTGEAGGRSAAAEVVGRLGKRSGTYRAIGQKLEFGFGATDDFGVAFGLLGAYTRIRNVPDLGDLSGRNAFAGFSAEFRWRLLDRRTSPFGLTLQAEPSIGRLDDGTGVSGRGIGAETKLILDRELVPDRLFGAINLIYEAERSRDRFAARAERGSGAGVSAALAYQVAPKVFLGAEARYLRSYDGLGLDRYAGDAVYLGPTAYAEIRPGAWLSATYQVQVAGREGANRRERAVEYVEGLAAIQAALDAGEEPPALEGPRRRGRLNLAGFERQQFRIKLGFDF